MKFRIFAIFCTVLLGVYVLSRRSPEKAPPAIEVKAETAELTSNILVESVSEIESATPEDISRIFFELKEQLFALSPDAATALIEEFLENPGLDASTGLKFTIGKGGSLKGHPSLRIALLDWLAQINPSKAASLSKEILLTPGDPTEWAIAMRNYALGSEDENRYEYLRKKAEEMITNAAWASSPSVGYLESFDVLVYTNATESAGLLCELAADTSAQGKVLAHAARLTLDRLMLRKPAAMMQELSKHPELAKVRGSMVANLFARADLRDESQQQLVSDYLLDPNRTAAELKSFSGIYPNANFSVSNNLLTENVTHSRSELLARDIAAHKVIADWIADPAYASVKPHLEAILHRLKKFVPQE